METEMKIDTEIGRDKEIETEMREMREGVRETETHTQRKIAHLLSKTYVIKKFFILSALFLLD